MTNAIRTVTPEQVFVTSTPEYDDAYRPVKVETTLPQVGPYTNLDESAYATEYTYTSDGQQATVRYPKVGKLGVVSPVLGSEIVTTHYDTASQASWAGGGFGWGTYVAESRYGSKGQLLMADLGSTYGTAVTYQYDDATNRLELVSLDRERVAGTDVNLTYAYDDAGNVTSILDRPTSTAVSAPGREDNQCFGYDGHRRLALAWTALDGNCVSPLV